MSKGLAQYTYDDSGSRRFETLEWIPRSLFQRKTDEATGENTAWPVKMTAGQFARMYWRPQRLVITQAVIYGPSIGAQGFDNMPLLSSGYRPNYENQPTSQQAAQCHQLLKAYGAKVVGREPNHPSPSGAVTLSAEVSFRGSVLAEMIDGQMAYYPDLYAIIRAEDVSGGNPYAATQLAPGITTVEDIGYITLSFAMNETEAEVRARLFTDSSIPNRATFAQMAVDFAPWKFND